MKVLIIGGTGLMSKQITAQLLERGDEVWHFNRGQTPARFKGKVKTLHVVIGLMRQDEYDEYDMDGFWDFIAQERSKKGK